VRLFQWYNEGISLPTLSFVDDSPNGGCIVICGFCDEQFCTRDDTGRERLVAPCCGNHMVYPRADW
jgi:hypothetical protein